MNGIILDLLLIAVILLAVYFSARRGFMRTLIEVAGSIAAIYLAVALSAPIAEFIYKKSVEPSIVRSAQTVAESATENAADSIWLSFPKIVTDSAESFGIDKNTLQIKISGTAENAGEVAQTAANAVAKPIITKLISMFLTTVAVLILLFLVRFLAKVINKLFSFSIIGTLNRFLGGALGIAKGLLIVFVLCIVISLIITVTKNGFLVFTPAAIQKSYIFKYIYRLSPFVK